LTIFLGELYAGRFPITLGDDPAPVDGEYTVRDKRQDRPYYTADGRQIPSGSPANPFGRVWLDLGKGICIHGSPPAGSANGRGCIGLSPRDADDVYGILSLGSTVRVLR
jgi:lipoprotein-anchoring transpeptidase ErfK/SrfK